MISRRTLIRSALKLTGAGLLASQGMGLSKAQAVNRASYDDMERFHFLSLLLTERSELNMGVSKRAFAACSLADPLFPAKMNVLWDKIQSQGLTSVRLLAASPFYQDEGMKDTVQKIVSAWYLGYTGTPVALRATDDTRFVTYTGALAYDPTRDATVIPTYSRGHTNYWAVPPPTLAND